MSLQLIYGRAGSGKTELILNKSQELHNAGKPFIVVVPEQYTHLAEKKLISRIGSLEQGRAEVLSFDRIAARINKMYNNSKIRLSKVAKTLIISDIIENVELKYYTNASRDSGFIEVFSNEISEFKKYNITCADVENAINKVEDKALKLKLCDIYNVYNEYENTISTFYEDSDDALGILADNLENHKPYEGYSFIFDEFSSFNPNEKNIITELVKQSETTYITFCADMSVKRKLLFKPTLDMAKSIEEICMSVGVNICNPIVLSGNHYKSDDMSFLENNLYSYPVDKYNGCPENIYINIYDNPYSEISHLAAQIKKIVGHENAKYKDIRVICPDISAYSHIIKNVFGKNNIPYFIDEKVGVLKHSIITSVINLLDIYIYNYSSESVISYLKSAYINIDRESLINIDNFITATNSSKNVWLFDDKWKKVLDAYCNNNTVLYNSIDKIRNKYILPLASFHDKIKGKHSIKYMCEELYRFVIDVGFDRVISEYIDRFKDDNNKYMQKQYELVWKALIDAMDVLVLVLGEKKVSVSQYKNYLYMTLREQKIGIIPSSVDCVTVGDIKRSKSDSTVYQFVVGATDGKFPVPGSSSSFISDNEKEMLLNVGVSLSPDSKNKTLYERFLTYVALSGTSASLILSYPVSDEGANALRPSFILTIMKDIFPDLQFNSYINRNNDILISNKSDSLEFLVKQATLVKNGKDADSKWQDIYKYYMDNMSDDLNFVDSVISENTRVKKLEKTLVDKIFNQEFYSTVSRLQRYNSCKYSYYLEYLLGLKPKKSFDPESTDIGTFVHLCIEKFFAILENNNKSIVSVDKEYIIELLQGVFEECVTELFLFKDSLSPKDIYTVNTLKNKVIDAIMGIRSHFINSSFTPLGHEITFSDDNLGCIEIQLGNNKRLKLTGKIDRADYFDNEDGRFLRVVDYKTGNKVFNISDVYYGLDIQLIVYLNALVKATDGGHHAGALFFKIQNHIEEYNSHPTDDELKKIQVKHNSMTGLVADDEHILNAYSPNSVTGAKKATPTQFRVLSDYVESHIKSSAENLSDGIIDVNPYLKSGTSPCAYCNFSKICNFTDGENGSYRKFDTITEKTFWETIVKKDEK